MVEPIHLGSHNSPDSRAESRNTVVSHRLLSYRQSETLCERLASLLTTQFGSELGSAHFAAIPRGGLIVLGQLSYALDLSPRQFQPQAAPNLVVVVDDCALSGRRFAATLEGLSAQRVVFAHLASPPALRREILRQEGGRVCGCVAALDLQERPAPVADAEDGFREAWTNRLGERRYWLGAVEPLAFAWSEPERLAWYEKGSRVEGGWNGTAPHETLRGRTRLGIPGLSEPGPLGLAADVLWKIDGDKVLLWRGESNSLFGLEGAGTLFWKAIMAFGEEEKALDFLEDRLQAHCDQLARDLRELVEELVERDLLTRSRA